MSKDNLSISKEAAKTIGLNQAVLLEVLNSLLDETKRNLFSEGEILKETSFWERDYLETILKNFVITSIPFLSEKILYSRSSAGLLLTVSSAINANGKSNDNIKVYINVLCFMFLALKIKT